MSRRSLLRGGLAAVSVIGLSGLSAAPARAGTTIGEVSRSALEDAVGSRVWLHSTSTSAMATLTAVRDLPGARAHHPEAFVAQFRLRIADTWSSVTNLADITLPDLRLVGVGLTVVGAPDEGRLTAVVDRRSVNEHRRRPPAPAGR
ncbi:hypothetical protein [Bogoriella caseilytica]|uniref:hypothetical protein n=1 Tax=Bogoriella caseilytica TaxID=56055 RepID=UPI0011CDF43E|nr:hypothetical protein [Bogoriella caseilytica]